MISKKLQRLHCETALTLIAKRPLSGRSFVDQHVMLFYHLVHQVTLILKVLVSEVLVSECSFPNPRVLVSEAEFPNPRAR